MQFVLTESLTDDFITTKENPFQNPAPVTSGAGLFSFLKLYFQP